MSVHSPATTRSDRTRWLILAMLFTCRTGLGLQFQTLGSVSGSLATDLGFSYVEIGTLIGLFILPGLLLSLPVGYAGRYLSDRTLVALGLVFLAAGGAIAAVAQGFGLLALGRIAAGVGFACSTIYFIKMVADWLPARSLPPPWVCWWRVGRWESTWVRSAMAGWSPTTTDVRLSWWPRPIAFSARSRWRWPHSCYCAKCPSPWS
jgi:MFS family permease